MLRLDLTQWLLALLIFSITPASADVLVLIHGYHSNGTAWRTTGVVLGLQQNGREDAGDYPMPPSGRLSASGGTPVVTVPLPSEVPLPYQSSFLMQQPDPDIRALITLASPPLGTVSAEIGALASDSPLGATPPFMDLNSLNRSRGLYNGLMRERFGSLLDWLNRQPHPEMIWISLVRDGDFAGTDDFIVPAYSQDMRNIANLGGRAISYSGSGGHGLNYRDGLLLADIIKHLIVYKQD